MSDKWMIEPDLVRQFNELPPSEYMNVVSLTGKPVQQPDSQELAVARIIAQKDEAIAALLDLLLRDAQVIQDVMDESPEPRPDLEMLLVEHDRLLAIGGDV